MPSEHLFGDPERGASAEGGASLDFRHPKAEGLFGRRANPNPLAAPPVADVERRPEIQPACH